MKQVISNNTYHTELYDMLEQKWPYLMKRWMPTTLEPASLENQSLHQSLHQSSHLPLSKVLVLNVWAFKSSSPYWWRCRALTSRLFLKRIVYCVTSLYFVFVSWSSQILRYIWIHCFCVPITRVSFKFTFLSFMTKIDRSNLFHSYIKGKKKYTCYIEHRNTSQAKE